MLVRGETGTGKELVARGLRWHSMRRDKPFVKVNCAALPADLLESELFGFERGAFTGAIQAKPGKFEAADEGTIFLDEIGEMSASLQAKLLQVLQDGEFSRLGGLARSARRRPRRRRDQLRPRARRRRRPRSARTSTSASTWSRSRCRRCASAGKTSRC